MSRFHCFIIFDMRRFKQAPGGFDVAVDACSLLLADVTLALLGDSATRRCAWSSPTVLSLYTGSDPTIMPRTDSTIADSILLRSGHIRVQEGNSYHAWGDVPLSAPAGGISRRSTRPIWNLIHLVLLVLLLLLLLLLPLLLLLLLRLLSHPPPPPVPLFIFLSLCAYVWSFPLKLSHALIEGERLMSMTLPPDQPSGGGGRP
jgi:hypothetical protein